MKTALLATALVGGFCAPAVAADLATRYPIKAVAPAVFSWTGFYIGGNVGYGGGDPTASGVTTSGGVLTSTETASITSSGFFAGGQIGYNYQFSNNVVAGIETDLQWSGINGTLSGSIYDTTGALTNALSVGSDIQYFGTIRGRLGYAIDRFLPYVTGGVAYGRTGYGGYYIDSSTAVASSGASTNWGWTVGAGGEFAVTNAWTVKAEYLYVDLGSFDYTVIDTINSTVSVGNADAKVQTIKLGANYKF